MSEDRIKLLEEKYWNAETSLSEEAELKEYWIHHSAHPLGHDLARYYSNEQARITAVSIQEPKGGKIVKFNWSMISVAASVLLVAGFFWSRNLTHLNDNEYVIEDSKIALETTITALNLLGANISKSHEAFDMSFYQFDKTNILK